MILILCHVHDADAVWLGQRLRRLSPAADVRVVSAEELLYARRVVHTLGPEPPAFALTLQSGVELASGAVRVLVNRLEMLDPVLWRGPDPKQYQYVLQEINALYLSMLHAVPAERLYNPPSAVALAGRPLAPAEWQLLARRTGLPIPAGWPPVTTVAAPTEPDAWVLVLDDEILGDLPPGIDPDACLRLAALSGLRLLELHFVRQAGGFALADATVFAALHRYGDALAQHFLPLPSDGSDLGNTQRVARGALAG